MKQQKKVKLVKRERNVIPIFFATDDNYVPFLAVSIKSMLDNASKFYMYKIYVLNEGLSEDSKKRISSLETENSKIYYVDLTPYIEKIRDRLNATLRDYYTASIFYRLFIAALYPEYKKAIYLDCDIVVLGDISEMYNKKLGTNILGACGDEVINSCEEFKIYSREGIGVDNNDYFNSGVLLMNLEEYRKEKIKERFIYLLIKYNFETAAPDQDYLNVLCKGKVLKMEQGWDKMSTDKNYNGKLNLIHYNNFRKPWLFDDVPYGEYFWEYAKQTNYYEDILKVRKSFTPEMEQKKVQGAVGLVELTKRIVASDVNFCKILNRK